jgi:hypothetical protein
MAQNRKATEEEIRKSLRDAIGKAAAILAAATTAYTRDGSLKNLRAVQVATDKLAQLNNELHTFDAARDPESIRRADANPARQKHHWPVGKPYEPFRRKASPPQGKKVLPDLPPPVKRPAILNDRVVGPSGKRERVSWWFGADRATLAAGSKVLKALPPAKTANPQSNEAIRKEQERRNDAKRDDRAARQKDLSKKLQEKLKPSSGDFRVMPLPD